MAQNLCRCNTVRVVAQQASPPPRPAGLRPPHNGVSRRACLLLPVVPALLAVQAPEAHAGVIGELVGQMWRDTQRNNSIKLLAPIKVAQQKLADAFAMMQAASSPAQLRPVLTAVRTSSLNCYLFEALDDDTFETKASLATQQMQFSDPCTFRLIVKNITGLSDPEERRAGEELVASLVLNYQKLDGELEAAIQGGSAEAAARAQDQLMATMKVVDRLESYVEGVLA